METVLERHKRIWESKKILRVVYEEYYQQIIECLSNVEGKTVELGAGSGNFKEYLPDVISADIEECEWLDMCFDAHSMPFQDKSLSNIVMIDVLHHLSNPIKFLEEASRVLMANGRLIMLEPYPSPFSLQIYKLFHPEPFIFDVDYYSKANVEDKDPWDSNQAIPYLLFYKHRYQFEQNFGKQFKMVMNEKLSCILYPASGGFENKALIPDSLVTMFKGIETFLKPLRPLMAFRCFVVLERK